ncbi:MAG: hypothetical protein ACR2PX_12570 [Endozoicomonas sp.]|uniref:hypothetical protein n=1 Tax=Endozoicomonas sp. TaxID=1892382 RepID=UPI003D9AB745
MKPNKEKLEEIRRKLRESFKKDKMFIENEPSYTGDPDKIFSPDPEELSDEHEKDEDQRRETG